MKRAYLGQNFLLLLLQKNLIPAVTAAAVHKVTTLVQRVTIVQEGNRINPPQKKEINYAANFRVCIKCENVLATTASFRH